MRRKKQSNRPASAQAKSAQSNGTGIEVQPLQPGSKLQSMDQLAERLELIVAATLAEDWAEVERQCDLLASQPEAQLPEFIARSASALRDNVRQTPPGPGATRAVLHLVGAYGRARVAA